jgi:hypothetical protein
MSRNHAQRRGSGSLDLGLSAGITTFIERGGPA